MFELLDKAANVFMLVLGVGCVWLGWTGVRRPRQSPKIMQAPTWAIRTWGVGYVVLGVSLIAEVVSWMDIQELGWPTALIRCVAGPLVFASVLAGVIWRWRGRRGGLVHEERRR
ncbi:hypothetical protein OH809_21000 [Streptomyces sp. NBC_00873]|uniref:hypothetical protein n=1 Tax=unclassified Streptomyces TaxID=2593676 RepID=UPI00386D6F52|nr:hypothetical protein OH809_21000 [Streptomyces sp. NBC_00873]WTA45072.1 hypothetical protein OH821_22600 [Streptomyces sp. NBC_00842]